MTALVRSKLLLPAGVSIALLALAAPALAGNGGFAPVPPASPNAHDISQTYWFVTAFALVILALVEIALVVFIVRFRRKKRARDVDGPQIHGSSRLETMWTVVPVVILFAIAAFVLVKLPGIKNVPEARAGTTNLVVRVTGRQYYWQFEYPNGVLPDRRVARAAEGRTVELDVTAPAFDVIPFLVGSPRSPARSTRFRAASITPGSGPSAWESSPVNARSSVASITRACLLRSTCSRRPSLTRGCQSARRSRMQGPLRSGARSSRGRARSVTALSP